MYCKRRMMRIFAVLKKYFLENLKKVLTNNEKRGIILLVVITKRICAISSVGRAPDS